MSLDPFSCLQHPEIISSLGHLPQEHTGTFLDTLDTFDLGNVFAGGSSLKNITGNKAGWSARS